MKLKQKDLPRFRNALLKKQKGRCALCGFPLSKDEAQLDHCHKSGHNRAAVHRDCNVLLGKIENYIKRYGKSFRDDKYRLAGFLSNCFRYMEMDYSHMPYHPTHKLPIDKKIKALQRRKNNAKRQSTKDKLSAEIRLLKKQRG